MKNQTVKNLKITVLVEDTCPKRPFRGEHGLSLWIQTDNKNILFDTGFSGDVLIHNLKILELRLESIDAFVLSHPHDDHSGGLKLIAEKIKNVPMYCTSGAFEENIPEGERISEVMLSVHSLKERLEIFPGVWIPQERETINSPKPTKEINVVINLEGRGLVVVVGCAHHGLFNMISDAKSLAQNKVPLYALLGGFHLKDTEPEEMIKMVNSLKESGWKILAPNHCTGFKALKMMAEKLPDEMKQVVNTDTGTFHTGMALNL